MNDKIILTLPMNKALDVGYSQPTTGVGAAALRGESVEKKVKKATVGYEDEAKGADCCDHCEHYRQPRECEEVEGNINPKGWCQLWSEK